MTQVYLLQTHPLPCLAGSLLTPGDSLRGTISTGTAMSPDAEGLGSSTQLSSSLLASVQWLWRGCVEGFLHGLFPGTGTICVKKEIYGRRERGREAYWEVPKSKGNPAGASSCQESTRALKDNKPSEVQCTVSA